ncbi:MAG: chemotaxis protein CheB [Micropepsaceae bacterium]
MPFDGSAPLVVGIGASAGGLTAFKKFFANMPIDNGMAFVLVQHLDPHHDSLLVALIANQTGMKVVEARDGAQLCANSVFIIPPDATLTIKGGALHLTKPAPPRELRHPIDTFFLSLAEDQGENAVCIVLAGTGSDGTFGLKAVKESGGLTMAQAEYDDHAMVGMPGSAAATGLVDLVLPVESMPARLIAHRAHLIEVARRKDASGTRTDAAEHLTAISAILRNGIGQDFGQYKESTLVRRVQRRMQVLQIDSVPEFIARLEKEPREVEALFRDILIGVTQFFRDPAAFEALQTAVMPKLLANKVASDQIRVWVAGCASGEEAYSIAILFREAMAQLSAPPQVQIFGSDIDDRAIARARTGRYHGPLQGISEERLERWFRPLESDYCVVKDVREMCVFSTHSLIKDPPFSKLHLVSCRNVMIYFDRNLQDRAIRNFHYALAPGGFLFLGSSEGITRNAAQFAAIDKKHRIFERRGASGPALPEFSLATAPRLAQGSDGAGREDPIDRSARRIVAKYSPSYVVIDQDSQVVRFSGGEIGQHLEPSAGVASLDLFTILRKSLRAAVRAAARTARSKHATVVTDSLTVMIDGQRRSMVVIVEPLAEQGPEAALLLIVFRDGRGDFENAATRGGTVVGGTEATGAIADLERDLATAKVSLRGAVDELETTTEEMKSSNEEFQSVNEELQASNEELETAKEEMQSVNEELRTINAEMIDKNEQLTRLNSDVRNLLDSTKIATIFLDNDLRIKSFTPGMVDLIHLRESDQGRPVTDLVSRLNYADLEVDVRSVLKTLAIVEHEVRVGHDGVGLALVMRIRPYRTVTNVVDGVVITFVDVTDRKVLEDTMKESERRLAAIVNQSTAGVAETDLDGRFTLVNPRFCLLVGRTKKELLGMRMQDVTHTEDLAESVATFKQLVAHGERFEAERRYLRPDGTVVWVHNAASPMVNAAGEVDRVLAVVLEITEHKRAEAHRELLLNELNHRVKNTLATVQSIAAQTAKGATSVDAYRTAFLARLTALSGTHNLLQSGDWHGVLLRDVVENELEPYRTDTLRWTIEGGDVVLYPNAALAFGMAVHELTTNAAKYGALSNGEGSVDISWTAPAEGDRRALKFVWSETGGPAVEPNRRSGFGTRLITEGLPLQLDGTIELEFMPAGVRCAIDVLLPPIVTRT